MDDAWLEDVLETRSHLLVLPAWGTGRDAYAGLASRSGVAEWTCFEWPDDAASCDVGAHCQRLRQTLVHLLADVPRVVVFAHAEGTVLAHRLGIPAVTMAGIEVDAVDSVVLDAQLDPAPSFCVVHCTDAAVLDVSDLLARDAWPTQTRTIRVQLQATAYSCLDADSAARAQQVAHDVRGRPVGKHVDAVDAVAAVVRFYDRECRGLRAVVTG